MKLDNGISISFINQGKGVYLIHASNNRKRFQDTILRTPDGKRWWCACIAHERDTLKELKGAVIEYITSEVMTESIQPVEPEAHR